MLYLEIYNVEVVPEQRLNMRGYSYRLSPCRTPTASTYTLITYVSRRAWAIGYWMYGRFIGTRLIKIRESIWTRACYPVGHTQEL